ncbi:MmgE/PrpD family protein [Plantactinospora solaniradicis]|uniref:MmgE/PrpD family protein n=1 Tax=Plantactinospora solaniradicis TaxID=1723736 RepID=A0ABW1KKT8_9ACTN
MGTQHPSSPPPGQAISDATYRCSRPLPWVAGRLASWANGLRFEDLPTEVVERTEQLILDQLGVQVLGTILPNVQPVRQLAASVAGAPESTVTGGDRKTSAAQAAYVNGTLGHSCEYDDAHAVAWHTSSAVVPAALALAERDGADGRELVPAVVAGAQVMALLGAATTGGMVATGGHGSKVLGVFSATPGDDGRLRVHLGQLCRRSSLLEAVRDALIALLAA